jgi:hypothetical protein
LLFEHHKINKQCHQHKRNKYKPQPQGRNGFHERPQQLVLNEEHPQGLATTTHRHAGVIEQHRPTDVDVLTVAVTCREPNVDPVAGLLLPLMGAPMIQARP